VGLRTAVALTRDDGAVAEVFDVPEEHRYVMTLDGAPVGRLDYALEGDMFVATHVVVEPAYGSRGLGSALVRHVLDEVRESGLALRPECPFVVYFLREHPEYADLLEDVDDVEPARDEVS
jgi:predicted GNAT family acetyltransferase